MSDVRMDLRALERTLELLEEHRIDVSRIKIQEYSDELGSGGFGTVKLAMLDGSKLVAVKVLRSITGDRQERTRTAFRLVREVKVWAGLRHPNILSLIGFHLPVDMESAWIVSSYERNGNVVDYIARVTPGMAKRLELLLDTANGLAYLHSRNPKVVHGDLKAANVLINDDTRAMLCDFGLAKALDGVASGLTSTRRIKGSFRYLSPELVMEEEPPLTTHSDMWAWACLAVELLANRIPFHNVKGDVGVVRMILRDEKPGSVDDVPIPPVVRDVVYKCWEIEPVERSDIEACVDVLSSCVKSEAEFPGDAPQNSGTGLDTSFALRKLQKNLDINLVGTFHHSSKLTTTQFSPDGKSIAVATDTDPKIILHDVKTGARICELSLEQEISVTAICFSPDGKLLATSGFKFQGPAPIQIWDVATRALFLEFAPPSSSPGINSLLAFSPDGVIIVCSFDVQVFVYDRASETRRTVDSLTFPLNRIKTLVISPDGQHVAANYGDGSVRIAEIATGTLLRTIPAQHFLLYVHPLAYAPDGRSLVATTLAVGLVKVWDLANLADAVSEPTTLAEPKLMLDGAESGGVVFLAFSPDGAWIISGHKWGDMRIWDAQTGKSEMVQPGDVNRDTHFPSPCFAFSPVKTESGWMMANNDSELEGQIRIWKFQPALAG